MDERTIAASPAAGPLTLVLEPLRIPTTIPPIIPAIKPESSGAPDASAIPRHKGRATKNVTIPAGKSYFRFAIKFLFMKKFKFNIKLKELLPV